MTNTRRPRVAAIGLDSPQLASIAPLCGELRPADSLSDYLQSYNWTETDVIVLSSLDMGEIDNGVNLITVGSNYIYWPDSYNAPIGRPLHTVNTKVVNTERELKVPPGCPEMYKPLAVELSRHLMRATEPPAVMETTRQDRTTLIETTSGSPIALRLVLPARSTVADGEASRPIALLLPEASNLAAWFRAFLSELHKSDPIRVPQAPPRLNQPSDWYTPQEKVLAERISQIESEFERLTNKREQLQAKLAAEGESADKGIRRALWADGDDLIAAVLEVLTGLGFTVRDMDAELGQDQQKREDLRLTREDVPGWEAIVEVKGYTSGIRTNDARQIREHRDRYIEEKGRPPDLTVWLSNPYRTMEPSSRPATDPNVKDAAETVDTVHALASDLYRQWALVAAGSLDRETVIRSLVNADPGLWTPPTPGSGT